MKRWGIISIGVALLLLAVILVLALSGGDDGKFVIGKPLPPGPVTPQIGITYNSQVVMLAPDGSLWAWGGSGTYSGPLAGRSGLLEFPQSLSTERDWRAVMIASFGVVALKADGSLWQWSSSSPGRGGSTNTFVQPKRIGTDTNWTELSGMVSHFMALKSDGSLWGWGQNESGQVGLYKPGDENNPDVLRGVLPANGQPSRVTEPTMVSTDHDWKAIAAGAFNSYALKQDGTLWGWGSGLGSSQAKTNDHSPKQIDPGTNWIAMAVGDYHLLALKSDGTLWLRGQNSSSTARDYATANQAVLFPIGQDNDWTDIYSGQNCFFARKKDGSWWACGDNTSGKLGVGNPIRTPGPARGSPASAVAARAGRRGGAGVPVPGSPIFWRQVSSLEKLPLNFDPWAFASGGETTLLLTKDGTLWTWGTRLGSKKSPLADKGFRGLYNASVDWLRSVFRPKAQTQAVGGPFGFVSPNRTEIVDPAPHKLWTLPAEVRAGLGTNGNTVK